MIVNSSTDPVLVKKIDLHIWTLRDEIEYTLKKSMEENPEKSPDVEKISAEYTGKLEAGEATTPEGEAPTEAQAETTEASAPTSDKIVIKQKHPVIPAEKLGIGVSLLSEINMEAIYFFSTHKLIPGQSVMIEFKVPKHFIMSADIVFCRTFNMKSRIISASKMPFRIGAKFSFKKQGERTLLRQFVTSIEPDVGAKSGEKAKESGDDELAALLNS